MFAVIESGGRQFVVKKGDRLRVNPLSSKDKKHVFDKVLLVAKDKGDISLGKPYVASAKVEASIVSEGKDKKVRVFKMKSKKRYRRTYGHRQPYTEVEITKIAA